MMNNEKEKDAIDASKLDEILPKYDPLKLNSINLAQNYVSAFNTGMNIYQCVNQLQGYIEWVVKAVNDVVKSWNVQVGESIDQSKAIVRETTTEQFNTEWTNKQPELIEQVNTLTTNQFNEDWGILENRINTTLETQNTNIQNIQNEQNELVTNTNNNISEQNTKINSIQTQQNNLASNQTNLANQQTTLSNRMDTFTSLSEGSTTGDAELQDIRVGANGTTYDTAGNAVRGQYSQLKKDLENVEDFSNTVYSKVFELEKDSVESTIDVLPILKSGHFESNGYVYDDRLLYLTSQVFPVGTYSIVAPIGFMFEIYNYNSDSSGTLLFNYRDSVVNYSFSEPFVITFRHTHNSTSTRFDGNEIKDLRNDLIFKYTKKARSLINGLSDDVVVEFYLLDKTYTPCGCYATEDKYRMKLKDGNGNICTNGQDVAPTYYSDKLQRFVDTTTGEIVAYYILHYTGTNYAIDSSSLSFTKYAKSLDTNPIIKEYLSRDENLVLIGDSIFGYHNLNVLESFLSTMSNKKVYNCGFGGCTMAFRTPDGSGVYDNFSFVSLADAIIENNYSSQIENMNVNQGYPYAIANLKDIDWSKPTKVFVNYVNNDITSNIPIGDMWKYTDTSNDFNKQTVLGAFNYGISKILALYPHVNVVEFTSSWRKLGNNLPPYAYTNSINLSVVDYDDAIKENAYRQGIAVYDFFKNSGRNWYNTNYYQQDTSHYNEKGFAFIAKIIDAVDKSFID